MSLIEKIKSDQVVARKERNEVATSLLTTLLGEGASIGKNANRNTTDTEMVALIKKFMKNNDEVLLVVSVESETAIKTTKEQNILMSYLPKQLTERELRDIIGACILTGGNMGTIMATLKTHHAGLYDGKIASALIKEILG